MRIVAGLFTLKAYTYSAGPIASSSASSATTSAAATSTTTIGLRLRIGLLLFRLHLLLAHLRSFQDVLVDLHATLDTINKLVASRPANLYHVQFMGDALNEEVDVGACLHQRLPALEQDVDELGDVSLVRLVLQDVVDDVVDALLRGEGGLLETLNDPLQDVAHG